MCVKVRYLPSRYRDTERQWTSLCKSGPRPDPCTLSCPCQPLTFAPWMRRWSISERGLITHLAEETKCWLYT
jgi:hypothetical protein